jgi:hypothetical protein
MLRCEMPHDLPPLPPDEFERRLAGFIDDVCTVFHHVLRGEAYPNTATMAALCDSVERRALPDLHVLNRVVGWVLCELSDARLPDEAIGQVLAAAWRISDCLHGPRNAH